MRLSAEAATRNLLIMSVALIERNRQIEQLKEDYAALDQTLTDTEGRLADTEERLQAWESAADALGPIGRPQ